MAEKKYFGDDMTISMTTEGGTTINIGEAKGVTVTPNAEHVEMYSADSIKRSDVKRREFSVDVEIEIASWDVAMIQQWLGGSGASSTSVVDTTDPQLFSITGEVTPSDGSTNLKAVVDGVYFDEIPAFDASEGEWVTNNPSGVGKDLTLTGA